MTEAATVIVNGTSGAGCTAEWAESLQERFARRGLAAQVQRVTSGAEIVDAAQRAIDGGVRLVVAGGGDGTVSAVAACVAGSPAHFGVLPMGTLNHFAKDLGLPLDLDEAIGVIAAGRTAAVDVGEVNGRRFINNASLGIYPDIVADRERQRRRLGRGKWRALAAASLHAARRYPLLDLHLEVDGRPLVRRTPFLFVGNNAYRMEGFEIGARAGLSDGQLSLYLTQRTGRFGLLALAFRAIAHRLHQARDFDELAATDIRVLARQRSLRIATDGELVDMATPLHFRILPGALQVRVP